MTFQELAEKRYSCRSFSDKKVEPELVDKIIAAGIAAPTAVNAQPFRIFRMESPAAKEAVRSCTRCHFGADTFLIVGYRDGDGWVRPFDQRPFADVDAGIVATHMLLAIEDLGLSTTWVGFFDAPALQEKLPALKGYQLVALFPIGYAAEDAAPSERHTQRKSAAELVEVL